MKHRQRVGALALASATLSGCGQAASPKAPEADPIAEIAENQPLRAIDFAPIAYFNTACARCHGRYGSLYGEGFAQGYDDAGLREIVTEMVNGPAQAPIGEGKLAALVAFHRALARDEPFLALTRASGDALAGEVSPGAQVQALLRDGGALDAAVEGHVWTLRKPEGVGDLRTIVRALRASSAAATTRLDPRASAYSHARPAASASEPP